MLLSNRVSLAFQKKEVSKTNYGLDLIMYEIDVGLFFLMNEQSIKLLCPPIGQIPQVRNCFWRGIEDSQFQLSTELKELSTTSNFQLNWKSFQLIDSP